MYIKLFSLAIFCSLFACDSDKGVTVFNPNPEVEIISHSDGDEVLEGFQVTFVGTVDDANHTSEQLSATWKVGEEIVCEASTPESNGETSCQISLTPEETEVILEVKDSDNARGEAKVRLTVAPSEVPVVEILNPLSTGVYYSDQKITLRH